MNRAGPDGPRPLGLAAASRIVVALHADEPDRDQASGAGDQESGNSGREPGVGAHLPSIRGYSIHRPLGAGGGGDVYLATRDGSDRLLALKLLATRLGSGRAAERAWRELDVLSQLHLAATPRVIDYGLHDGRLFIAAEYVEGLPLDKHCESGDPAHSPAHPLTCSPAPAHTSAAQPLSLRDRVSLLARVADAVHSLHERGIIHRDLKPSNILIDGRGDPVIIDLGLAMLTGDDPQATLTLEGTPLGSPAFMAPEQARGERSLISTRTDVYGLGATAYAILTGHTPHAKPSRGTGVPPVSTSPTPSGTSVPPVSTGSPNPEGDTPSIHEMIRRVSFEPPREPRELNPALPRPLAAILSKAVAREPGARYPSAASLAADLRRWLNGEPVSAQPPTP